MGKYSVNKLPSDTLISIAEKVTSLRKELGWTQRDLVLRSGVSYGSLKRFEQTGQISFESLLKIAESLDRLDEFDKLFLSSSKKQILTRLFEA